MNFIIRPVKIEDAVFINKIRRQDGVRENIMGITSERVTSTEGFINGLTDNDHILVAEVEENGVKTVVGVAGLSVNRLNRLRHSGSIGIMVQKEYHKMGIGRALMTSLIDIGDNWLMLIRIELGVFTDNEKAINLYKSLGFEIEGTKKYAIIRNGKYDDEYLMARYNI